MAQGYCNTCHIPFSKTIKRAHGNMTDHCTYCAEQQWFRTRRTIDLGFQYIIGDDWLNSLHAVANAMNADLSYTVQTDLDDGRCLMCNECHAVVCKPKPSTDHFDDCRYYTGNSKTKHHQMED